MVVGTSTCMWRRDRRGKGGKERLKRWTERLGAGYRSGTSCSALKHVKEGLESLTSASKSQDKRAPLRNLRSSLGNKTLVLSTSRATPNTHTGPNHVEAAGSNGTVLRSVHADGGEGGGVQGGHPHGGQSDGGRSSRVESRANSGC